jgi:hypothetical protein
MAEQRRAIGALASELAHPPPLHELLHEAQSAHRLSERGQVGGRLDADRHRLAVLFDDQSMRHAESREPRSYRTDLVLVVDGEGDHARRWEA